MTFVPSQNGARMRAFIEGFKKKHGHLPSVEHVREHMNWKDRQWARVSLKTYRYDIGKDVVDEILETDRSRTRVARRG
jgi:hypothetical protein